MAQPDPSFDSPQAATSAGEPAPASTGQSSGRGGDVPTRSKSSVVRPERRRWRIEGALTIDTVAGIRARLLGELPLERLVGLGLDLARVDDFDAAGLQLLLSLGRTLGSGLTVENPSRAVAEVLAWTPIGARYTSTAARSGALPVSASVDRSRHGQDARARNVDWLIGVDSWHLSLRFDDHACRAGIEPLAAIRRLAALGALVHATVVDDRVPRLEQLNPTVCRLGFELDLRTDIDPQHVRRSIDALGEHAWVRAIAPAASIDEYVTLIHLLPEGSLRASKLFLASGVLTPHELETGLRALGRARAGRPAMEASVDEPTRRGRRQS